MQIGAVLSLTGRFARFGTQAERGLAAWSAATGHPPVTVLDDAGDPDRVVPALAELARRCDGLLGPYSTALMRPARRFAADTGVMVWNQGGAGDDVQTEPPCRVPSVLAPTSRAAEPFVAMLAARHPGMPLRLLHGSGTYGRQIVAGAREAAARLGVPLGDGGALFTAGTFEEDVDVITGLDVRPAALGTPAAGVAAFATAVPDPDGVYGIAQWLPSTAHTEWSPHTGSDVWEATTGCVPWVGPAEAEFLRAYGAVPDYPAVQAAAAAALAAHCGADADPWAAAVALRTTTLFGRFAIDPVTGAQTAHAPVLTTWRDGQLVAAFSASG